MVSDAGLYRKVNPLITAKFAAMDPKNTKPQQLKSRVEKFADLDVLFSAVSVS